MCVLFKMLSTVAFQQRPPPCCWFSRLSFLALRAPGKALPVVGPLGDPWLELLEACFVQQVPVQQQHTDAGILSSKHLNKGDLMLKELPGTTVLLEHWQLALYWSLTACL